MFDYIIVQAGGKGSRLEHLTYNKPKALVSIENLPMIFHLFKLFPDKKYIIIGDYKFDVLEKYLKCFCDVDYRLVSASGYSGTLAGLNEALNFVEHGKSFMLIWSDIILAESFKNQNFDDGNYVGIANEFPCRWRFENNKFDKNGVAGVFVFQNKECLKNLPKNGEFVHYLSESKLSFKTLFLPKTKEFGLLEVIDKLQKPLCRPFNTLTFLEDRVVKQPVDQQGFTLAENEINWYKYVSQNSNIKNLPKIYDFTPLTIEKIGGGKHLYELGNELSDNEKEQILKKIICCLKEIHKIKQVNCDYESFVETYLTKTVNRLNKVKELIPFADKQYIKINEKKCRNILFYLKEVSQKVFEFYPDKFCLIHGDSTFSNILLSNENEPVLIDPRGYFGKTKLFGDVAYDWAKLFYSLVGNYDQFNLGRFRLKINENDVELKIQSSNFEGLEEKFFNLIKDEIVSKKQIKLYHSIIWYSLTTYAWNDYDSICGAFYKGCEVLEEYFKEVEND